MNKEKCLEVDSLRAYIKVLKYERDSLVSDNSILRKQLNNKETWEKKEIDRLQKLILKDIELGRKLKRWAGG